MPTKQDPLVVRVLMGFRAQMDAMELVLMDQMGERWLNIERGLRSDMSALAEEMARRTAAGETVTKQMIWRSRKYKTLNAHMIAEIQKYNKDYAVGAISDAQGRFSSLGIDAAQGGITAMYPSPLSASFDRINVRAVEAAIGFAGDGSPLLKTLTADYGDAADGVIDALVNGLGRGLGPTQIANDMADGMGMGLDRALLIARTESARSYRAASVQQYRDSGVVDGFMRLVKKATACAGCLMLDGEVFELADDLEDHPKGKCQAIPIIQGILLPDWDKGPEWFLDQTDAKQKEILGKGKWELWKDGQFELSDMARKTRSATWGSAPRPATLNELIDEGGELPPKEQVDE